MEQNWETDPHMQSSDLWQRWQCSGKRTIFLINGDRAISYQYGKNET